MRERLLDGVEPIKWARPERADEVENVIRETELAGDWLMPIGGGTGLTCCTPADAVPVALDLGDLHGIDEYEPTDLTVSVRAGTTWSALQAQLAEHGQTLPIDVPFPDEATIGGVTAAGYAGPRRLRDGTLKDLLIGASFVRGDGLAAKAGGMVVKNVSGFEIPRLLHGSMGSLAVITSVNLKVIPQHEHEITIISQPMDTDTAIGLALALTRRRIAIAAAVVDGDFDTSSIAVRLTGLEQPTRALAREIIDESGIDWRPDLLDNVVESSRYWQRRENELASTTDDLVAIDIGAEPSNIVAMMHSLGSVMPGRSDAAVHVSPGTGGARIMLAPDACSLDTWRRVWREHGLDAQSRHTIAHAPREWRRGANLWSIPDGPLKLMNALKATFDPDDVLNRGRLWTSSHVERSSSSERS